MSRLAAGFTARVNLGADVAVVVAAVYSAAAPRPAFATTEFGSLLWVAAMAVSAWVVSAAALRHYASFAYERSVYDDLAMVSMQTFAVITTATFLHLLAPAGTPLPRVAQFMTFSWVPIVAMRLLIFRRIADIEEPVDEVLVVGTGPMARLTAQDLRRRGRHAVIGHLAFADENGGESKLLRQSYAADAASCRLLGHTDGLEEILRREPVDEVYIAGNMRRHADEMQAAVRTCERLGVPFALPAYSLRFDRAQAVELRAVSDGYLHYENSHGRPAQMATKRLFDIVVSAMALWLLLPLFLVTILVIKLTSRGPVFFRQERVGRHGRRFNMLKFRSMVVNAEELKAALFNSSNEQTGPVFKMKYDPRVTRVGRFIRIYSIDELPQLINVLRGDMSIVGPRPPVPEEVHAYQGWQRRRLSVRPGLTCIWQVSGRNQISFEDWMYLDMRYIDHWSLSRDLELIFRTLPVVITGRGAS